MRLHLTPEIEYGIIIISIKKYGRHQICVQITINKTDYAFCVACLFYCNKLKSKGETLWIHI